MQRRYVPAVLATALMALVMVSCGDDTVDEGSSPTETLPTPTDGSGGGQDDDVPEYTHPSGADDVVFEYSEVGGFVPRSVAFQSPPVILISGGGRVFTPGAQIAIYPGPLLPAIQVQTISELGIQRLLGAADEAGLYADIDYSADLNVADASTAMVTINVDGETWVHEAYALGIGAVPGQDDEADVAAERAALNDFLAQVSDLATLVGPDELGPTEIYEPDEYLIEALVVEDPLAYANDGIEPTIVAWPAGATVPLADAASCTVVPADEIGGVLESANQLTLFSDAGIIYQVLAKQKLPGPTC
jgi:hypothetical protein